MSDPADTGAPGPIYAEIAPLLASMGSKVEDLLLTLLRGRNLDVLRVNYRVKTELSARNKILRKPDIYGSFDDLHDMLGLRIITYLASTVDDVVALLRDEFEIDEARSADRSKLLHPDRFGYLSVHLIAQIDHRRDVLPEWAPYADHLFEIQIRSALQHAWAEIEHDLGYKADPAAVPAAVRRRFARISGLLEIADTEFDAIAHELQAHAILVSGEVAGGNNNVAIDQDSVAAFIKDAQIVYLTDQRIASLSGRQLDHSISWFYAGDRAVELSSVGFGSLEEVARALSEIGANLADFAAQWLAEPDPEEPYDFSNELPRGISLFYLYLHMEIERTGGDRKLGLMRSLSAPGALERFVEIHRDTLGRPEEST